MTEHEKLRTFIEAVSGRTVPNASFDMLARILDRMRAELERLVSRRVGLVTDRAARAAEVQAMRKAIVDAKFAVEQAARRAAAQSDSETDEQLRAACRAKEAR